MGDDKQRISELEAAAMSDRAEIARLFDEAVDRERHIAELDARALLRDERIIELMDEVEGLNRAAETRAVIDQAKGTIMAATGCSADAAFAVLVAQSQRENRKLLAIAEEIMRLKRRADVD